VPVKTEPCFVKGMTSDWHSHYLTMFHMTNASELFRNKHELEEQEGASAVGQERYDSAAGLWLPLYEGKSVQIYNHRYASIVTPVGSVSGQGQSIYATLAELTSPDFVPAPEDPERPALPPGHEATWDVIIKGTPLEGTPYPIPAPVR